MPLACAGPDAEGVSTHRAALLAATGGLGADHVFLAAGGTSNGPVETRCAAGAGPRTGRRHRQDQAGPAVERLLREGARRPVLPLVRARPLRRRDTSSTGSTTRSATSAGPNAATCACFLDLLATESIDVASLISGVPAIEDAAGVYEELRTGALHGVGFLLRVPASGSGHRIGERPALAHDSDDRSGHAAIERRALRLGFIGAGNYATSMLLPHLAKDDGVALASVATTRSLSAANAQRKFGFADA